MNMPPRDHTADRDDRVGRTRIAHTARATLVVVAIVVAVAGGTARAQDADAQEASAPNPLTCSGYAQPRTFLESQSWWRRTPGATGTDFGHVHSGACFPYMKTLKGFVRFDVRTLMHDNPNGRLYVVRVQAFNNAYGTKTLKTVKVNRVCGSTDCTFWTTVTVDTSTLANGGLTEFRIHSEVRDPDGSRNLATNGYLAYIRNGKPVTDTRHLAPSFTEGRGWYRTAGGKEFGYENARLRTPIPSQPLAGVWLPEIETRAGSGGEAITQTMVMIDPQLHAVPEDHGMMILHRLGPFKGRLSIDTTELADGPHRLMILGSAKESVGSTLSGAFVIPFVVDNSAAPDGDVTPPSVTLTTPLAGATVGGVTRMNASVSDDAATGVLEVRYFADGVKVAVDDTAPDWDEGWDTRTASNGAHTLVAKARDAAGNWGVSSAVRFYVRN